MTQSWTLRAQHDPKLGSNWVLSGKFCVEPDLDTFEDLTQFILSVQPNDPKNQVNLIGLAQKSSQVGVWTRYCSNIQIHLQNTLNPVVRDQPVTPLFAYPDFSRTMLTQKHVLNGAKADVHVV